MKVVNKKYMITIITILVVIEVCTMFLMYKSLSNKDIELENVSLKEIEDSNMLAIMLEQDDGTYEESETWPVEGYVYDESKSGCMDSEGNKIEGALTYDSETNIASVETGNTAYCYLYFKIEATSNAGLYAEDGTLTYTWDELIENGYITVEDSTITMVHIDYIIGKLIIDDSITTIGSESFLETYNLTSVLIPSSVTIIEDKAFCRSNINTVIIPNSIVAIYADAFFETSLTTIYYTGTEEEWNNISGINDIQTFPDNVEIYYNYVVS